ncbi:LbetaH domain-containing protein [Henriciella marina]|uniref:hypothetical protein n=1 Tax=Henriciella marina TaxID=453851 RepID=UPI00146141E3|nr:hypothetical protein [Henriciella marina]
MALKAFNELKTFRTESLSGRSAFNEIETATRLKEARTSGLSLVSKSAVIHRGVHLIGDVVILDECEIGPNSTIFGPTVIGPGSYVGPGAEIRTTIAVSRLKMAHASYLGHSLVGADVTLSAGFITAVRNLKREFVYLNVDGKLVCTGHKLFGAIIADGFNCRINYEAMPGRVLLPSPQT